jgi:hypothetical protein
MALFLDQSSNDFEKTLLEILCIHMVISSIWPDIRLFLVSGIRPNIRQVKSDIRPHIRYKKRLDYPAGYPVHP